MTGMKTFLILVLSLFVCSAWADQPNSPRYTFSWQLGTPDAPAPRGGTTKGPAITADNEPTQAWKALQEPGLSPLERDRRAILAMAGDYRVTFDFLEVETFPPQTPRDKPYQSWGTERVYVDADNGKTISLVHILDMRIVQDDGSTSAPIVTKHWRQTWQYEPAEIVEFKGRDRWEQRKLSAAERSGEWSQTVYQVDESPRYASVGRWSHSSSFSSWISGDTWRPLPRREWSVRKDYQVLLGTNRHTINATGWVQEENNLKMVLTPERALDTTRPYLAREYGVARYSRIKGYDFAAADEYYQRTRPAAVGAQDLSVDPTSIRARQERNRVGNVLRRTQALEGRELGELLDQLLRLTLQEQVGSRRSRRHHVDGHVAPAQFLGKHMCHSLHASLGRRVGGIGGLIEPDHTR